jgi:hypothetical protein
MGKSVLNLLVEKVFVFHFLVDFQRLLSYFLVRQRSVYSTLILCIKQSRFFGRGSGILKRRRVSWFLGVFVIKAMALRLLRESDRLNLGFTRVTSLGSKV